MGNFNINMEDMFSSLLKAMILGIAAFAVTYLRGIGQEIENLNVNLVQLKYEISAISESQNAVNKEIMSKLNSHESRLGAIERKKK